MNVGDAIRKRRSIRVFRNKSIEEEKLNRILEAGRLAPSARNMQDWKFVVVRKKETRESLMAAAKNQPFVGQAPVLIVACGTMPEYVMSCGQPCSPIDVAIALTQMALVAVEEGLGTCWVCAFSESEVKRILGVPDGVRVIAMLSLGHPAEDPPERQRKDIGEVVAFEHYS